MIRKLYRRQRSVIFERSEPALLAEMQNYVENDMEQVEMVVQRTHSPIRISLKHVVDALSTARARLFFFTVFRDIVCKNMKGFDFHASMFTIVVQLVDKLDASFNDLLPTLTATSKLEFTHPVAQKHTLLWAGEARCRCCDFRRNES